MSCCDNSSINKHHSAFTSEFAVVDLNVYVDHFQATQTLKSKSERCTMSSIVLNDSSYIFFFNFSYLSRHLNQNPTCMYFINRVS